MLGIFMLYHNHAAYFAQVKESYKHKDALNLDETLTTQALTELLVSHDYVPDATDAGFIASWIVERRSRGNFANLGALNLRVNRITADTIMRVGGNVLRERLARSQAKLGIDATAPTMTPPDSVGNYCIRVEVHQPDSATGVRKVINKILGRGGRPAKDVPVRLTEYRYSAPDAFENTTNPQVVRDTVVAWARTNEQGVALLPAKRNHHYSVIPVNVGYEYGKEQGTVNDSITQAVTTFSFTQRPHTMPVFDSETYSRIKEDRALTVRTPEQWTDSLEIAVVAFLLAWWLAYYFIGAMDRRMGRESDRLLLVILMAMSALCLLAMFAIADPLVDRLLGGDMTWGVVWGVMAMCALSSVNYVYFYMSQSRVQGGKLEFDFVAQALRWIASPFADKIKSLRVNPGKQRGALMTTLAVVGYYVGLLLSIVLLPLQWLFALLGRGINWLERHQWRMPAGIGYLLLAVALVVLLRLFGTGPEGSGARVNLWFFQPSEVSKYLVVIFIAAFFAVNADTIRSFADRLNRHTAWFQFRSMVLIVLALCFLLMLYLLLISDMGPGLVLIVTFIFLYSVARGDFVQLVLGVVSFIVLLLLARMVNDTITSMMLGVGVWLALWIVYGRQRKQLYESAVFMNALIVVFMFGGQLLSSLGVSEGERLASRNAVVWSGVWNNDVPGGDQVAQGLWSLATGGLFGQGLGNGNASLVPAFNTDMIFTSIGEVMGWIVLLLIMLCLAVLLHRSLLLARRSGHPFTFFLVNGITIVTGVQFFVIVLGSIGIIPLTGVAVPLLSYGKSSFIINLAAFGIILSCSRMQATVNQRQAIVKYNNVVAMAGGTFIVLSVVLLSILLNYQLFSRGSTLVRPAYVANTQGARIAEYNPRISLLMNRLDAGNIYDRNGLLLATSSADELHAAYDRLSRSGLSPADLKALEHKKLRRYYPFAEHTFFMVGDYNTRVLWNSNDADPYGYLAESRHLTELRGFDNVMRDKNGRPIVDTITSRHYRECRFLPSVAREFHFTRYDYSPLISKLESGFKSKEVEHWNKNRHKRDLTLTIDANLQRIMQEEMAHTIKQTPTLKACSRLRAGVVVLNAATGDLLTSACYPLPDQQRIADALNSPRYFYRDGARGFKPYTDRDLGLTFQTQPGSTAKVMSALAGFMKLGDRAATTPYAIAVDETVDQKYGEPSGPQVMMRESIVQSSNCYFVHLVNDQDLYTELDSIYRMAGIRVNLADNRHVSRTPYYFDLDPHYSYGGEMEQMRNMGVTRYTTYMNSERPHNHQRMNWFQTGNAWGQHNIYATPLNMARVAAMVANDGSFVPTRYVLRQGTNEVAPHEPIVMTASTALLKNFMQLESDKHRSKGRALPGSPTDPQRMGGKTGTPERGLGNRGARPNDAWYIFFVRSAALQAPLAVAVRLERTESRGSGEAVQFAASTVIPALNAAGYQVK